MIRRLGKGKAETKSNEESSRGNFQSESQQDDHSEAMSKTWITALKLRFISDFVL
jgi:hypothetical protein